MRKQTRLKSAACHFLLLGFFLSLELCVELAPGPRTRTHTCRSPLSLPVCQSLTLTHSTHSLVHSFTHSLTHSCSHSLMHSLTLTRAHSPTYSLSHPLTHPLRSLARSLTHSLTHSRIMCICVSTGTCAMSMAVSICRHTETCTVHRQTQHRPCTGPVLSMAVLQMGLALYRAKSVCKQSRNRRRPAHPKTSKPAPETPKPA